METDIFVLISQNIVCFAEWEINWCMFKVICDLGNHLLTENTGVTYFNTASQKVVMYKEKDQPS